MSFRGAGKHLPSVMPGLVPGIHAFLVSQAKKQGMDGRDIGERSDAVLRTAMPGHDSVLQGKQEKL